MEYNPIIDELLSAWEETYKKGQLTFWVFLALKEGNKCMEQIKEFVERMSQGTMTCEEQSLYRIIAYDSRRVSKGPDRKYYYLTPMGNELFKRFAKRNILLFTNESIINLLNK